MPRTRFQCSKPGCDQTLPKRGRCAEHERPSSDARGYRDNQRLRREWAPRVATGTVRCWRCRELIAAGSNWHVGHGDHRELRGPEHAIECNLRTAGINSHIN
jgi:hypothetical protein